VTIRAIVSPESFDRDYDLGEKLDHYNNRSSNYLCLSRTASNSLMCWHALAPRGFTGNRGSAMALSSWTLSARG